MPKIQRLIHNYDSAIRRRLYSILKNHPRLARAYLLQRRSIHRIKAWWQRNDNRYGLRWRLANGAVAAVIIIAAIAPTVNEILTARAYALSGDTQKLIGKNDARLTKQLTYDAQTATYQFNKDAVKSSDTNPAAQLKSQVGSATGDDKNKSLYALDVPTDASKGVTYHDINSGLSFGMSPKFTSQNGRNVDGHIVFPLSGGNQAIYTLKNNGLKEDIVVPKVTSDTMTFQYKVNLPKTLAMKIIPDSDGAIGVYAGDPNLFGDMQYGSDKDRKMVETARENAEKNYLVFGLPAPIVKNVAGNIIGSSKFQFDGATLSVVASGLDGQTGPITVDPSVIITSSTDFRTGNDEGNIDFSNAGQITQGSLTGGSTNSGWVSATNTFTTARYATNSIAYNGYLYVVGGQDSSSSNLNDIQYAAINTTNGSLGIWQTNATNLPASYSRFGLIAYNSYMYIVGGNTVGGTTNAVLFARINNNGSIGGNWTSTSTFNIARQSIGAVASNGYIYISGGLGSGGTTYGDLQYAMINADGTLGSWTTSSNVFSGTRYGHGFISYNGYLYVLGGRATGTNFSDVQYAHITATVRLVHGWQQQALPIVGRIWVSWYTMATCILQEVTGLLMIGLTRSMPRSMPMAHLGHGLRLHLSQLEGLIWVPSPTMAICTLWAVRRRLQHITVMYNTLKLIQLALHRHGILQLTRPVP